MIIIPETTSTAVMHYGASSSTLSEAEHFRVYHTEIYQEMSWLIS